MRLFLTCGTILLGLLEMVYSIQISQKRSNSGSQNQGLSNAEIAGLVVAIVGIVIGAPTAMKGWRYWMTRRRVPINDYFPS
ncbi:hypothetical protein BDD12DRAFT_828280 [Trichophaea hybrida]|nr:hypothetical protein BDD12DRAFT_828280 [Trichophaea hybrida]